MQPLPFPIEEINTSSLSELQNKVRRIDRIMKNFRSDTPRRVWTRTLSGTGYIIACMPGTNLILSYNGRDLTCWDILTCLRVAHLEVSELNLMTEACVEVAGKALFGARIGYVFLTLASMEAVWLMRPIFTETTLPTSPSSPSTSATVLPSPFLVCFLLRFRQSIRIRANILSLLKQWDSAGPGQLCLGAWIRMSKRRPSR